MCILLSLFNSCCFSGIFADPAEKQSFEEYVSLQLRYIILKMYHCVDISLIKNRIYQCKKFVCLEFINT